MSIVSEATIVYKEAGSDSDGNYYRFDVEYSVNNEIYSKSFYFGNGYDDLGNSYVVGASIPLRYMPNDPSFAFLEAIPPSYKSKVKEVSMLTVFALGFFLAAEFVSKEYLSKSTGIPI